MVMAAVMTEGQCDRASVLAIPGLIDLNFLHLVKAG
jgi:hypothetical protein